MSPKPVPPSIDSVSFSCPHCGAHADQYWYDLLADAVDKHGTPTRLGQFEIDHFSNPVIERSNPELAQKIMDIARRTMSGEVFFQASDETYYRIPQVTNLSLSQCYSCKGLSVWVYDKVEHPPIRQTDIQPNEDIPPDILRDFDEARTILDSSPRGAAALLRLCVQKLCAHLGEPGKDLNADIGNLVKKGLDSRIQQALDVVRVVGNESVHPGTIDLRDDRATAIKLFDLVNLIAQRMITEEREVARMFAGLPEAKLRGIAERDKPKT
jgi:hypothetical protein